MSKYEEPMIKKKTVEALWDAFGDCNRDDDDCIDSPFCGLECGTNVHEIWHWFDRQYARWGGVHALMFPDKHKKSKFGSVRAYVRLETWVHDYAITVKEIEFDCAAALDRYDLDDVELFRCNAEEGRADEDTDGLYYTAVEFDLVEPHDGPFDCYILDVDELDAYIQRRKEVESGMHYYEFLFFGSDKLLDEGWRLIEDWEEDNVLSQSFYGKSDKPLESIEQAKEYLRKTFPVTEEYNVNLVNCLDEHTVEQLAHYFEIDAQEFEISCGVKA